MAFGRGIEFPKTWPYPADCEWLNPLNLDAFALKYKQGKRI